MNDTLKLIALIAFCSLSGLAAENARKPNVLFLVSDDLRPELGCYGVNAVVSPNIDKLARRGMVFGRAYCQQAVCSPSRSSVMTGMRPDTTRVWNLTTHFRKALPDVVTLPQLFRQNGYISRGYGKIYHSDLQDPPSWTPERGEKAAAIRRPFDSPTVTVVAKRHKPTSSESELTTSSETKLTTSSAFKLTKTNRGPAFRKTDDPPNGGGEGRLADEAIAALRKLRGESKPFFLAVGFHKPHLPFNVPKHYWDLYDPNEIPMAPNPFLPIGAPDYALVEKPEMWNYSYVPDTPDLPEDYRRQLKHGYYAAVSYMDAQLGRVLDELDRLGLTDSTIIVLWGDHGWKLGEHRRWAKHSNVENDAMAPLLISVPGMKQAGSRTDSLVEFVDIYPTIADLAGLDLPADLEGVSLKPMIGDPTKELKAAAFSQYPRTVRGKNGKKLMGYSMRTDRYRFTRWVHISDLTRVDAVELYDHEKDPQENRNIAGNPENSELIKRLTKQLKAGWKGAMIE
jgi:iduronate 2-sulfatase